jgi:hypothetical protein
MKSGFNDKWLGSKHQDGINLMGRVRANYSRIAAERLGPLPDEELAATVQSYIAGTDPNV